MRNSKTVIYSIVLTLILTITNISAATAATRLAPTHLYSWAARGDLRHLQQYRRYINLQDSNHNTALCLAQQDGNRDAYQLLLKFGASTKVACHDDNDPICAMVVGEKLKVNPAAWWIIGAGAGAAGIYALLKDKDHDPKPMCPIGYTQDLKDCSQYAHPEGYTYEAAPNTYGLVCGRCVPHGCTRGKEEYSRTSACPIIDHLTASSTNVVDYNGNTPCYECQYQCDETTAFARERSCTSGGYLCELRTFNGVQCYVRTGSPTCDTLGPDYHEAACQAGVGYIVQKDETTTIGDTVCHKCTYQCDISHYWQAGTPSTDVFETKTISTPTDCYGYIKCKSPYIQGTSAAACGQGGEQGWIWETKGSATTLSGTSITCGLCTAKPQCSAGNETYTDTSKCPTKANLVADDTNVVGYKGNTPCYECSYKCDEVNAFKKEAACKSGGYTCTLQTFDGVQCYVRSGSESCPTGYQTETCKGGTGYIASVADQQTVGTQTCYKCAYQCDAAANWVVGTPSTNVFTTSSITTPTVCYGYIACKSPYIQGTSAAACGQGGEQGWDWSVAGTAKTLSGNTITCGLCTAKPQCSAGNETYTDTSKCPTKANLVADDTNVVGYKGNTPCYECSYKCDEITAFKKESACKSGGYTCTLQTFSGVQCYVRSGSESCPTGYQTETCKGGTGYTASVADQQTVGTTTCYKCAYQCNTSANWIAGTPSTDVFTTSSITTPTACYGYIACKSPYIQGTSAAACGQGGEQGWIWETKGSATTLSGTSITCGLCTAKPQCSAGNETYTDTSKCPTKANLVADDTNVVGYKGNTPCYECSYKCDEVNAFKKESACKSGGYTCTLQTFSGVQCYVRSGSESCPTGYQTETCKGGTGYTASVADQQTVGTTTCYKCAYQCNTSANWIAGTPSTDVFTTSSITTPTACYGYIACKSPYIQGTSATACGQGGEQGWTWETKGTATTLNGSSLTCGLCTAKTQCSAGNETYTDTSKCPTRSNLVADDTNVVGYKGNTPCYQCSYKCNETTAFQKEKACTSGGYSCTLQTFSGVQCYVRNASGSATTRQRLTNKNVELITLSSNGDMSITAISDSNDIVNTVDEETGSAGRIAITHNATGIATGIHGESSNGVYNRQGASIEIANNNGGRAVGIHVAEGGSAVNEGNITITGNTSTGTAIGIYGEGKNNIVNEETGVIDVTSGNAYGIYVNDGTDTTIENKGIIRANGENAHGIYVNENGAKANVYNTGSIYLNGTEAGNTGITLNGGELRNASLVSFDGSADLNQVNAIFFLEDGGVYEAESLSGDLHLGASNVLGSNLDTYVNEGINADNTEDLNVLSESAMFTASLQPTQAGHPTAVTLNRQNFATVAPNASIAQYLEKNYAAGNMTEMYDKIKNENTLYGASRETADQLGYNILPNFVEENFTILKSLNRNITDKILAPTKEVNRITVGGDYIHLDTNHKSYLAGYELNASSAYMFGDKRLDNKNRLGLGIDFTNISTNYDGSSDRKLNIVTVFMPYLHQFTNNLRLASILSFGYGDGEYDRGADRESDITDIFYGFTNELRYTINLNGFAELEPALMLNAIGYTEDGFEEDKGSSALISKKTHNNSVEAGVGLFLKKNVTLSKFSRLNMKIGGAYYREFADPYDDLTIRHRGAAGWYKINDYAHIYDNDRALLEAALGYEYKKLSVTAKYNQLIQRDNPSMIDVDVRYNF